MTFLPGPGTKLPLSPTQRLRLAVAALVLIVVAFAGWLILRGRDGILDDIRQRGVWRVGMDPSFPPFQNLDVSSGQVVGLDVDLALALGEQLEIKTEITSLGFDELVDAVAAHRIDAAISALPVMPERTQEVRFSDPYVQAGVVLVVLRESVVQGAADLQGRRVAVEWGSQGDAEARRLMSADGLRFDLLPKETVGAALDAVVGAEVDAAIVDAISLALYRQSDRLTAVSDLVSDPYVVVVAADALDLLEAVNEALDVLESNGTLPSMRERWLRPAD